MNMGNLGIMPKVTKKKEAANEITNQTDILSSFQTMINNGEISQFIIAGLDSNRQLVIATYCKDVVEGLGTLDLAKIALVNQQGDGTE